MDAGVMQINFIADEKILVNCRLCGMLLKESAIFKYSGCEWTNAHVKSFAVGIVGKMAQDVGMVCKYCDSHLV